MSLLGAPGNIESTHDQALRLPMLDARQACAAGSDKNVPPWVTPREGWDGAGGMTT